MNETTYQRKLIREIQRRFLDCIVLKPDAQDYQGIPDLLVLYRDRWGMLEVKISPTADEQPNQRYYVGMMNDMSFAAFINPQNEGEVLDALQSALGISREACVS